MSREYTEDGTIASIREGARRLIIDEYCFSVILGWVTGRAAQWFVVDPFFNFLDGFLDEIEGFYG